MKTNVPMIKNASLIILFVFSLFSFFGFSPNDSSNNSTSYMTIAVEYHEGLQGIIITEGTEVEQILFVQKYESNNFLIKKLIRSAQESYKKRGYKIKNANYNFTIYDNREILKIIDKYTNQGWKLHSQSLGAGLGTSDESTTEHIRSVQYILER